MMHIIFLSKFVSDFRHLQLYAFKARHWVCIECMRTRSCIPNVVHLLLSLHSMRGIGIDNEESFGNTVVSHTPDACVDEINCRSMWRRSSTHTPYVRVVGSIRGVRNYSNTKLSAFPHWSPSASPEHLSFGGAKSRRGHILSEVLVTFSKN